MVIQDFHLARLPEIVFGEGALMQIIDHKMVEAIEHVLLVTGGKSFCQKPIYGQFIKAFKAKGIIVHEAHVSHEPTPQMVDKMAGRMREKKVELVVAIGGGSVMDAGKAVSAMIPQIDSVMAYLEGVGEGKQHNGIKVPMIAVPTTSGTGSEATKNAVLSSVGEKGFKKSIRHDVFVPDVAVLDSSLMVSCPRHVTAASGLDALTQLMGGYLSTKASPITDALALSGIQHVKESLIPVCTDQSDNPDMRGKMAYGALMSGVVLANAGLGIVHGFASPVGGYFKIPHGVVCGTLLAEAVKMNIRILMQSDNKEDVYLKKYAKVGALLTGSDEHDIEMSCSHLIEVLDDWVKALEIPRLGGYGITEADLDKIVNATGNKNNPVELTKEQMKEILRNRL